MQAILTRTGEEPVIDATQRDGDAATRPRLLEMLHALAERLVDSYRDWPAETFHYPPF